MDITFGMEELSVHEPGIILRDLRKSAESGNSYNIGMCLYN